MSNPTEKQLASLPKWALKYISLLQSVVIEERKTTAKLVEMFPWSKPGMEWFTLFRPPHRPSGDVSIFTCDEGGTRKLVTLGPNDYLFIGRGKKAEG